MKTLILRKARSNPIAGIYTILIGATVSVALSVKLDPSLHIYLSTIGALFIISGLYLLKISGGIQEALREISANRSSFVISLVILGFIAAGLSYWSLEILHPVL